MPSRLHTDEILSLEVEAIFRRRDTGSALKPTGRGRPLYRQLNECKLAALCLSGGGIRSAAFGLGVLQALASSPETVAPTEWDTISEEEVAESQQLSACAIRLPVHRIRWWIHRKLAFSLVHASGLSKHLAVPGSKAVQPGYGAVADQLVAFLQQLPHAENRSDVCGRVECVFDLHLQSLAQLVDYPAPVLLCNHCSKACCCLARCDNGRRKLASIRDVCKLAWVSVASERK